MSDQAANGGVDVRTAVAVADGSLTGDERARAQARLEATPAGRRAVEQQQRVVRALRASAPVPPPELRAAVQARTARPTPARARLRRPALASGVIAALVALAILLLGGPGQQPTVAAALELAMRPATQPPPPPQPTRPTLLALAVDGIAFPNWALARRIAPPGLPHTGWKPIGARRDEIAGRRTATVFYKHMTHVVAYTIVAGDTLDPPPHARRTVIAGHPLWRFRDGHRDVIVFTRQGHTCVLAGHVMSPRTLDRLATWRGGGSVNF